MSNLVTINPENNGAENQFKVVDGQPYVSSLYVAEVTGKEHFNVIRDIKKILEECEEDFGKLNFDVCSYQSVSDLSGRKYPMYWLSEDGSSVLLGGYSISHRVKIQKELREFKTKQEEPKFQIPQTLSQALLLASELALEIEQKDTKILTLETKIDEDKDKVSFADTLTNSDRCYTFKEASAELGYKKMGQNNLFKLLRSRKVLLDNNIPARAYIENKDFKVIEVPFKQGLEQEFTTKTLITVKGLKKLDKLLTSLGYEKIIK